MRILGLTGDIACGKSTVARILNGRFGVVHLDSDRLVRELYARKEFAAQLAARFGDVLNDAGEIDRPKLGALVFSDAQKLRELEAFVHPAVAALRREKLDELAAAGEEFVVVEAVKLLEAGQGSDCDEIWCVVASPAVQTRRLIEIRGFSAEEAQIRLDNQPSRERKMELAGNVPLVFIENNGTLEELETMVEEKWREFQSSSRQGVA